MNIEIDWEIIDSDKTFYEILLPQLDAPEWHGRNLDALNDSLVTGSINGVEPPYRIININTSKSAESITDFQRKVFGIFADAAI